MSRRLFRLGLVVVLALAGMALIGVVPAFAGTIVVHPGDSIQRAVHRAHPGDTIIVEAGVYHESVQIQGKDNITLKGAGASDDGTVLMPAAETAAKNNRCARQGSGICVFGGPGGPTAGTRVSGFEITGFGGFGVVAFQTVRSLFDHNAAIDDGEYGMASFDSTGNRYILNVATGNEEAGFYYGDSPMANGLFRGNVARDNEFGFFLRDSAHGRLFHNVATDNCDGFLFLDTGAPVDGGWWTAIANVSSRNDRFCPASEDAPSISGVGIAIVGDDGIRLSANHVKWNVPGDDAQLSGGVIVISSVPFGGSDPNDNAVRKNWVVRNQPLDVLWDGSGSGNVFARNTCHTSSPAGICA